MDRKLVKLGKQGLSVLLIGFLLVVVVGAGCTDTDGEIQTSEQQVQAERPRRDLPATVTAGQEFEVSITFTAAAKGFHAIGLSDIAPPGWNVSVNTGWPTPPAMEGHTPQPEQAVYVWSGPHPADTVFTAIYKVRVPPDAEPGIYSFSGALEYRVEPHPARPYREPVTGDVEVRVTKA